MYILYSLSLQIKPKTGKKWIYRHVIVTMKLFCTGLQPRISYVPLETNDKLLRSKSLSKTERAKKNPRKNPRDFQRVKSFMYTASLSHYNVWSRSRHPRLTGAMAESFMTREETRCAKPVAQSRAQRTSGFRTGPWRAESGRR